MQGLHFELYFQFKVPSNCIKLGALYNCHYSTIAQCLPRTLININLYVFTFHLCVYAKCFDKRVKTTWQSTSRNYFTNITVVPSYFWTKQLEHCYLSWSRYLPPGLCWPRPVVQTIPVLMTAGGEMRKYCLLLWFIEGDLLKENMIQLQLELKQFQPHIYCTRNLCTSSETAPTKLGSIYLTLIWNMFSSNILQRRYYQ